MGNERPSERAMRITAEKTAATRAHLIEAARLIELARVSLQRAATSSGAGMREKLQGVHDEVEGWGETVNRLAADPYAPV